MWLGSDQPHNQAPEPDVEGREDGRKNCHQNSLFDNMWLRFMPVLKAIKEYSVLGVIRLFRVFAVGYHGQMLSFALVCDEGII